MYVNSSSLVWLGFIAFEGKKKGNLCFLQKELWIPSCLNTYMCLMIHCWTFISKQLLIFFFSCWLKWQNNLQKKVHKGMEGLLPLIVKGTFLGLETDSIFYFWQIWIIVPISCIFILNLSTPKIWLLIFSSSCCTFPCKLVMRIWC